MKKIKIKATGATVEKTDFVADLFVRKGKADYVKEKKDIAETKELKTKTETKKKK